MKTTTTPSKGVAGARARFSVLAQKFLACLLAITLVTTYAGAPAYALDEALNSASADNSTQTEQIADSSADVVASEAVDSAAQDKTSGEDSSAIESTTDSVAGNATSTDESAELSLLGDPAEETVSATIQIVGPDANGADKNWLAKKTIELPKGSTAADLTEAAFTQAGLTADYGIGSWGWSLNTITSPFTGEALGYDVSTGKYWQLFVDGAASWVGAGEVVLSEESPTTIYWYYSAYGAEPVNPAEETVSATIQIVGPSALGTDRPWVAPVSINLPKGSTAADLTEAALEQAGLEANYYIGGWGWYLDSITSPYTGEELSYDYNTGEFWQLFVNGASASDGAGEIELAEDGSTSILWYYSGFGESLEETQATCTVIGLDANGNDQIWVAESTVTLPKGSTAADLTEVVFEQAGLDSGIDSGYWGWWLNTITSPYDSSQVLEYDEETGKFWQLFVNGAPSELSADGVVLEDDGSTSIVWYFSAWEEDLPEATGSIVVNPGVVAPDIDVDWSGYGNTAGEGTITDAATPQDAAKISWALKFMEYATGWGSASEVMIADGYIYFALDTMLIKVDASSGEIESTANLANTISYTCRPIISQGLILVPLDGGSVQALTADSLTTKWISQAMPNAPQTSCTLTIEGNNVIVGAANYGGPNGYKDGCIFSIDIATGQVAWSHTNSDEGYYWTGGVVVDGYYVTSSAAGTVEAFNTTTGAKVSSLSMGASVNSDIILGTDGFLYLVSRDGVLHKLAINKGVLSQVETTNLGVSDSVCTPTICNGMLIVGSKNGLVVTNLGTYSTTVISSLKDGGTIGDVRSTPLVSKQGDKTIVYFTNNTADGSLYQYVLGEENASRIWEATGDYVQYCDSPVAVDKNGTLYYIIDYSALVALIQDEVEDPSEGEDQGGEDSGDNGSGSDFDNQGGNSGTQGGSDNQGNSGSQNAGGSNAGSTATGSVAPGASPVAAGEEANASAEPEAINIEGASVLTVDDADSKKADEFNLLPIAGIAAGVLLLGVAWWLIAGKRRKDDEE